MNTTTIRLQATDRLKAAYAANRIPWVPEAFVRVALDRVLELAEAWENRACGRAVDESVFLRRPVGTPEGEEAADALLRQPTKAVKRFCARHAPQSNVGVSPQQARVRGLGRLLLSDDGGPLS